MYLTWRRWPLSVNSVCVCVCNDHMCVHMLCHNNPESVDFDDLG